MLGPEFHAALRNELHRVEKSRGQVEHFSKRYPAMDMADSYAIQRAWVQVKLDEGRKILGHKIGLTSRAMQISSQITEPDHGAVTDDMRLPDRADIPPARQAGLDSTAGGAPEQEVAFLGLEMSLNRLVHDSVHAHQGSISAEHGLGVLRRDESARYKSPLELHLMRRIKKALDPNGLMNPGKLLSFE